MPSTESISTEGTSVTDVEPQADVPWRSPVVIAILATTLMTPMDVPLISPALTEIQAVFAISESTAGLLITLYALPGILLAPVIGSVADRIGRRYVLTGCLALFGLSGTAIAFTSDFVVALGLRLLQGTAAGSILSALAMTVVGDRFTGRQHDAVMGITAAMLSVGTAAYPAIGGVLASYAWNAPFLLYAIALPVAGIVLFALDDSDVVAEPASKTGGYLSEALRAIPIRDALRLYGIMFVAFVLLFGGIYTALPFYLTGQFGLSPTTVGLFTSAMLLVTAVVSTQNGRLTTRIPSMRLLAGGFGLFAFGLLGVALADTPRVLLGGLLLFGTGSGLVTPTLFAAISTLAPDHIRGGVMSLQTTVIGTSQAVGPALFTTFGGAIGYRLTLLGASGGAALCMIGLSVITRR